MKIINDMEGKVPIKYAFLVLLLGTLLAIAGIMNFHQAYQTIPQSLPLPICR